MDPFSIAVGAISCASAAVKICSKGTKTIQGLRNAPGILGEIIDDVANFQRLVSSIRDTLVSAAKSTFIAPDDVATMSDLFDQAKKKLLQIEMILEYEMIDKRIDDEKILISRCATMRNEKEVARLRQDFNGLTSAISIVWQAIVL